MMKSRKMISRKMTRPEVKPAYLDANGVMARLNISGAQLDRMVASRALHPVKLPTFKRIRYFQVAEVEALIEATNAQI
jgi:hypothetical protein